MDDDTIVLDDLQGLDRLTEKAKRSIIVAFEIAKEYNSTACDPVHLFLSILRERSGLPTEILEKMGLDIDSTAELIQQKLEKSKLKDNKLSPEFSEDLKSVINQSYVIAQRMQHVYVGTEHLLVALVQMSELDFVKELSKVGITPGKVQRLILATGTYPSGVFRDNKTGDDVDSQEKEGPSSLEFFGSDMNELAANNVYLPIYGREEEIHRIIHILSRKTKNNPILVGDAGVGKTAIVEGFVQRLVEKKVPTSFMNTKVINLDIAGILAGSKVRGDVEERVLAVINEAMESGNSIIFIDEIHMIVGAGSAGGSGASIDIANILKPYLTGGELKVIGATTMDEYRKYFESDPALTRRFQPIQVEEIDSESAYALLENLKSTFEKFHKVKITDEAIDESIKLSKRYIADRYLPDKAIDLLDEASAQVKIGKEIEVEPKLSQLGKKLIAAQRKKDKSLSIDDIASAAKYKDEEKKVTDKIVEIIDGTGKGNKRRKVGADLIRNIVSKWTGIPVSSSSINEGVDLNTLEKDLENEVRGQDKAIDSVVAAIKRSHLNISSETKPLASFLFLGPTGVGKTQLAKSLAKSLFGAEEMIIQIDMSEYMESHSVSKLIGSPPGYVGYQEGGQLTEKVRRRPYSVILFDEVEKAHPNVLNILLQILNDGNLQDSQGRNVSFKNSIIVLTSNIGAESISKDNTLGFDIEIGNDDKDKVDQAYENMSDNIIDDLKDHLRPELINRLDEVIVFRGLNKKDCVGITSNSIERLKLRLIEQGILLDVDKSVVSYITDEGYSKEYGGRNINRKVQQILEDSLADFLLDSQKGKKIKKGKILKITAKLDKNNKIKFNSKVLNKK